MSRLQLIPLKKQLPSFKQFFHIKYFFNFKQFAYFNLLKYSKKINKNFNFKLNVDVNKINFFFRLKNSIKRIRILTLQELRATYFTNKQANIFFLNFRFFSVLNYI